MKKVGIIGGMGPYAGADYLQRFLQACTDRLNATGREVLDQNYPPHYLLQHPVPDRTAALLAGPAEYRQVLAELTAQLRLLETLGTSAAAMACNTAHAWHADLQQAVPGVQLLHIAEVCAQFLSARSVERVGLLATAGTVRSGMYAQALAAHGVGCVEPSAEELDQLMTGIYGGVKAGDVALGRSCFQAVVARMAARTGVTAFLMACTEIPLALQDADVDASLSLYDPTRISAGRLAHIALA